MDLAAGREATRPFGYVHAFGIVERQSLEPGEVGEGGGHDTASTTPAAFR